MRARPLALMTAIALAVGMGAVNAPAGQATPAGIRDVRMSTDGFTTHLASTVTVLSQSGPMTRSQPYFGNGTVPTYYGSITEDTSEANTYFLAHGGHVRKTGASCGTDGTVYQLARVTVSGLGSDTKRVWALWDGDVGANASLDAGTQPSTPFRRGGTAQWENASIVTTTANGAATGTTITLADAANFDQNSGFAISSGQFVTGAGVPDGTWVTKTNPTAHQVTVNQAVSIADGASLRFARAETTTSLNNGTGITTLCDGTTPFVGLAAGSSESAAAGVVTLGTDGSRGVTSNDAAGLGVASTTSSSISFDVYVPTQGDGQGWKYLSLAFLVDNGTIGTRDAEDYGIQTQIYARPFNETWETNGYNTLLTDCGVSPAAGDAPCLAGGAAANGVFTSGGSALGSLSVKLRAQSDTGPNPLTGGTLDQVDLDFDLGMTSGADTAHGFEIPAGSIVKMRISLPTTGTINGVAYGSADLTKAIGTTSMRVDPADPANTWSLVNAGGRTLYTFIATATTTSQAIDKASWSNGCHSVEIDSATSTAQASACEAGAGKLIIDSVPADTHLNWMSFAVVQSIGGGYVSTNAQATGVGMDTYLGRSFQFAVAGPHTDQAGDVRDGVGGHASGYYFVCLPAPFLLGSFGTTPAAAVTSWQGTRDGAVITDGVQFTTGTCGTGPGLVASYPNYHYSAPLFSVRPPAASGGGGTSLPSPTPTPTPSASASTPAPATPVVTPIVATAPRLPAAAGQLTPAQAAQLTTAQLGTITARDAARLRPSVIAALSPAQLAAIPAAAFAAVTPAQAAALKPAQLKALPAAALGRLSVDALESVPASALKAIRTSTLSSLSKAAAARLLTSVGDEMTWRQRVALRRALS